MKEFFQNKRNIAIVSLALAVVLAVSGVATYFATKPETKAPADNQNVSENVSGEARTEENTADATEESATAEDKTEPSTENQTESTTAKKETSTTVPNKKPENKSVTTTRPQQKPKPSQPQTNPDIKNPITGQPVPGMDEEEYRLASQHIIAEYGSVENYKKEVERVKNYKCMHCGKHDCPSIEYRKDAFGNITRMGFDDKCPAVINHTAKCPHCDKPMAYFDEWQQNKDKYCDGSCHLSWN